MGNRAKIIHDKPLRLLFVEGINTSYSLGPKLCRVVLISRIEYISYHPDVFWEVSIKDHQ